MPLSPNWTRPPVSTRLNAGSNPAGGTSLIMAASSRIEVKYKIWKRELLDYDAVNAICFS